MNEYYGVQRSTSLSHYGVKGMKWGVRKAIKKGDKARLKKHHDKAVQKLYNLHSKANLLSKKGDIKDGRAMAALGAGMIGTGVGAHYLGKGLKGYKSFDNAFGATTAALGVPAIGLGAAQAISARRLSGSKGHAKAVKKVNDWQNAMKETFKGTSYEKHEKGRKPYSDTYSVRSYARDDTDHVEPKIVATISGSKLTRNYKGADKDRFIQKASKRYHAMVAPDTKDYDPMSLAEYHVSQYLTGRYKNPYTPKKKRK